MSQLSLISVSETVSKELTASGAHVTIRISGQSFFTGKQAFTKAAEVAECVELLKECGLEDEHITLAGVTTQTETGLLSRSSSASYQLVIRATGVEQLGKILAVIASRKNATIVSIAWQYTDLESTKLALLAEAAKRANAAANAIAGALNAVVSGLHSASYNYTGLDDRLRPPSPVPLSQARLGVSNADMELSNVEMANDLSLYHTTRLDVTVNAEFAIGGLSSAGD